MNIPEHSLGDILLNIASVWNMNNIMFRFRAKEKNPDLDDQGKASCMSSTVPKSEMYYLLCTLFDTTAVRAKRRKH